MDRPTVTELFVKRVPLYDTLDMFHNDIGNEFIKIVRRHNLGQMNWSLAGGGNSNPVKDTVGRLSFDKQGSFEIMARQEVPIPFYIYRNNLRHNYTRTLRFRVNCVDGVRQTQVNESHKHFQYGHYIDSKVIF